MKTKLTPITFGLKNNDKVIVISLNSVPLEQTKYQTNLDDMLLIYIKTGEGSGGHISKFESNIFAHLGCICYICACFY